MALQHRELAGGRWFRLSLAEQLAHVGSEVSRARRWQNQDPKLFEGAFGRALELLGLTIADPRWRGRLKELARLREVLGDAYLGGAAYRSSFEALDRYFLPFAVAARKSR